MRYCKQLPAHCTCHPGLNVINVCHPGLNVCFCQSDCSVENHNEKRIANSNVPMGRTEMEKAADAADKSVLFFLAGANF